MALLLPVSTMESPNTRMAGTRGLPRPPTAAPLPAPPTCHDETPSTSSSKRKALPCSMSCAATTTGYLPSLDSIRATMMGRLQ
uniref:Uncharacterized protein n=1 Tax=Arundo donax TaxID=35708 RepID=A0A0A9EGD9_ARUDO